MYVLNITDDYDNLTLTNCTDDENNIDIIMPTLFLTKPCGLSFLCLIGFMVYTLIKLLFKFKKNTYSYNKNFIYS